MPIKNTSVYVAGPVTKPEPITNCRKAVEVCDQIRSLGFLPFCPQIFAFWDYIKPHDYEWWMSYDMAWQDKCDCTLRIPGFSLGADREVARSESRGRPVFYSLADLIGHYAKTRVYLICPVRNASLVQMMAMEDYVRGLEAQGYEVHYPPRDVDQSNDDGGIRICQQHLEYMAICDEVHVWWDDASKGSHYDLGMAAMLRYISTRPIKIVVANGKTHVPDKSFQNVLADMAGIPKLIL